MLGMKHSICIMGHLYYIRNMWYNELSIARLSTLHIITDLTNNISEVESLEFITQKSCFKHYSNITFLDLHASQANRKTISIFQKR
jgi:hypothetical protein